jgi:hypothetical protein
MMGSQDQHREPVSHVKVRSDDDKQEQRFDNDDDAQIQRKRQLR